MSRFENTGRMKSSSSFPGNHSVHKPNSVKRNISLSAPSSGSSLQTLCEAGDKQDGGKASTSIPVKIISLFILDTDHPSRRTICVVCLFARVYTQTIIKRSFFTVVRPDGWSVSSINRANGKYTEWVFTNVFSKNLAWLRIIWRELLFIP